MIATLWLFFCYSLRLFLNIAGVYPNSSLKLLINCETVSSGVHLWQTSRIVKLLFVSMFLAFISCSCSNSASFLVNILPSIIISLIMLINRCIETDNNSFDSLL